MAAAVALAVAAAAAAAATAAGFCQAFVDSEYINISTIITTYAAFRSGL